MTLSFYAFDSLLFFRLCGDWNLHMAETALQHIFCSYLIIVAFMKCGVFAYITTLLLAVEVANLFVSTQRMLKLLKN